MKARISSTRQENGRLAAGKGAGLIRDAIRMNGQACIVLATGASQFDMLDSLVGEDVDWSAVIAFHLDEYIGLPESHPASFRRYLKERFCEKIHDEVREFHFIDGNADPDAECRRLADIIRARPIDVAFVGVGENCHLAFNDPPADFETDHPYIIVDLDEDCRKQQLGEGWFTCIEDVPRQAISMSIRQIMRSRSIICTVPDIRKARAVRMALEGPVTPDAPASILQEHDNCIVFLDEDAASMLQGRS